VSLSVVKQLAIETHDPVHYITIDRRSNAIQRHIPAMGGGYGRLSHQGTRST